MTALSRQKMTVEDYLDWASRQDRGRTELYRGEIVAMAPEVAKHARAKFLTAIALRAAIKRAGVPCEAFVDSLAVRISDDTAYEPDALVNCGPLVPAEDMVATNPVIVVEILSPSSRRVDTNLKLADYFRHASVMHYLIVNLERRLVTHHRRGAGEAIHSELRSEGAINLDPPGLTVMVAELLPEEQV